MPLLIRTPGCPFWVHYGSFCGKWGKYNSIFDEFSMIMTIVHSQKLLYFNRKPALYLCGYSITKDICLNNIIPSALKLNFNENISICKWQFALRKMENMLAFQVVFIYRMCGNGKYFCSEKRTTVVHLPHTNPKTRRKKTSTWPYAFKYVLTNLVPTSRKI